MSPAQDLRACWEPGPGVALACAGDMRFLPGLAVLIVGCTPPPSPEDGGVPDAGAPDAGHDAGAVPMTATMGLFAAESDAGTLLEAFVTVHGAVTHAYDDGPCTADPIALPDADAAWLRMSGYTAPGQPIVCMNGDGGYFCQLPSGEYVTAPHARFDAGVDPLGSGPILFATGGGADVGPATVSGSPNGTLWVQEDLSTLPATIHVSCADGCGASRVLVKLRSGTGALDCDFAYAPVLTIPLTALNVSGPVFVTVVRIPSALMQSHDHNGAVLVGQVGRGVWSIASH
jgi:hypothetical protein